MPSELLNWAEITYAFEWPTFIFHFTVVESAHIIPSKQKDHEEHRYYLYLNKNCVQGRSKDNV